MCHFYYKCFTKSSSNEVMRNLNLAFLRISNIRILSVIRTTPSEAISNLYYVFH